MFLLWLKKCSQRHVIAVVNVLFVKKILTIHSVTVQGHGIMLFTIVKLIVVIPQMISIVAEL
jgi:hypothetical protein